MSDPSGPIPIYRYEPENTHTSILNTYTWLRRHASWLPAMIERIRESDRKEADRRVLEARQAGREEGFIMGIDSVHLIEHIGVPAAFVAALQRAVRPDDPMASTQIKIDQTDVTFATMTTTAADPPPDLLKAWTGLTEAVREVRSGLADGYIADHVLPLPPQIAAAVWDDPAGRPVRITSAHIGPALRRHLASCALIT